MRKWIVFALLALTVVAWAEEKATIQEVVDKCKKAEKLYLEKGDAALEILQDPTSEFTWKDTYVWIIDGEKMMNVTHPVKPEIRNKDFSGLKDNTGRYFFAEFVKTAMKDGEGWVEYNWPKPGAKEVSTKVTYVRRIGDTKYIVASGVYDYTKEQVMEMMK